MILALITGKNNWLGLLQVDGDAQFKNGFWYRKLSDGNFISYEKRAKCIYPKCDGWVYIESAPAREKNNHILVGKCSVGGIRHAYTVDYNDIGYPHEFDWGPLEKKSKI
jgi:hypothetical protein